MKPIIALSHRTERLTIKIDFKVPKMTEAALVKLNSEILEGTTVSRESHNEVNLTYSIDFDYLDKAALRMQAILDLLDFANMVDYDVEELEASKSLVKELFNTLEQFTSVAKKVKDKN